MKRRAFVSALAATPAVPVLLEKQAAAQTGTAADGFDALKFSTADAAGTTVQRFFSARQFATLRRLGDLLMPRMGANPGATEARVAEFLDFHLSQSPAARQQLYSNGLDTLEFQAQSTLRKAFADTSKGEGDRLLAALRQPWTEAAASPLVEFLRTAKADVRTATMNSREYADAQRNGGPASLYWKAVE